ncbi:MAG: DUF2147 domain-containing protein [Burkholderiaceae bacterium]|jgi:uncharacterized protein (DUF2147 family)|nr:DUF2147 domain-containing protein [Burkholderiaceae bacterium]MBU6292658.1 DUF2147 domain-containing protein [Burkholderiales bacterium]NCV86230.1 DUF2147 domain-containing protein [Oxalobacteraceae bacterium]NDG07226.1 DUF2147 domain-containing protein [Oxalobacteraceae bacterium]
MKYITFFALLLGALLTAQASDSPVGLWRTIDDKTGKEKSLVRVVEVNGEFKASIEKLFREPHEEQNPNCDKCPGDRKNKPVLGMTIMTGLKKTGSEYEGGEILDPANGKIYRCKMWTAEGGKKLNVRGFVGVAVLGRTQVWLREE